MPLTLYKRGSIWHYRGTVDGKLLRGSTKTANKTDAQQIASEKESRAWKRRLDGPESVTRFSDCVALYAASGKPTKRFVKKLLDYWRETPVREITASAVQRSCRILYPNGSNATWNRQVIVPTQAIINFAAEAGMCRPLKVRRLSVTATVKEPATWEWMRSFGACSTPALGALSLLMFLTGARISEALAIKWSDIDMGRRTILIRMGKTGGDERIANMPPELVVALANLPGPREGRIWPKSWIKTIYKPTGRASWRATCQRAGIPYLSPHCLRHGFATTLLQKGIDVRTVAELGGWKTPSLVLSTYAHAMKDPRITDRLTETDDGTQSQPDPARLLRHDHRRPKAAEGGA